ncbi:MAG TPA: YIP1 family protein [Povalibacter sp.]|uniref:YIP1 family protein n=1 Tax=Povalibacter sp. TaxID=1962978 RepID=UPI002BFB2344|nr:YIP1 family protein [Povalibacter sp.]HMN45915.1 YIP1 family protein [Povalibacter sp.]
MNNMELAGALVTAPAKAFENLKEKPRFLFPLLVIVLSTVAVMFWYYRIVDFDWLVDRMLSANPRMNEQQREAAMKMMSPGIIMWSSLISVVVVLVVARVVETLYYLLAGNVTNVRHTFLQWLSLSCWTALPHVIGTLSMAVFLLTSGSNQISNEELNLLSLNELLFHIPAGGKGYVLLSSLTLLHPWVWWLTVVGVRTWTGRSWLFSSLFALTPIVLLYGGWALWAFK